MERLLSRRKDLLQGAGENGWDGFSSYLRHTIRQCLAKSLKSCQVSSCLAGGDMITYCQIVESLINTFNISFYHSFEFRSVSQEWLWF